MAQKKIPVDQRRRPRQKKPWGKKVLGFFKVMLLLVLLVFFLTGGAAAAVVIQYINEAPSLDLSRLDTVETSYIYDRNGFELTDLHEEQNRIIVSLEDLPGHVSNAFIAIEDERYYSHFGFDVVGSLRAAYANFQSGRIVQGASTISQQLAQNAFLTTETSYERKIQEIWLAIQLERIYSKKEILEMYINRIYFGHGAYGVEAAAQTYFGKEAANLDIAEAAMLAGIVRSPNFYNPFNNQEQAESRANLVLRSMHRLEMISDREYERATRRRFLYAEPRSREYPFPYYIDHVLHRELVSILRDIPEIGSREEAYRAIYTGGLRVYTNLDRRLQQHVEDLLNNEEFYPQTIYIDMDAARQLVSEQPGGRNFSREQLEELTNEETGVPQPQAAVVVACPISGQIMALGGGREYSKGKNELLRFNSLRQPGSAIKPLINYGPAFEEGTLPGAGATLDDSPYIGPQENWFPENFDYRFRGMVTVREALYRSYNIPAVRSFELLGPSTGVEYAKKMGISSFVDHEVNNLALTLGGFTRGVSALDMAQAYAVLANDGIRIDLHTVERITDRHGNTIYEFSPEPQRILSPQAAFLVNDILQDFVTQYTGRPLQIDRPVAGKTGTTSNFNDVYLAAYTPNLVATFWMGYDELRLGNITRGWQYSTAVLREVFLHAFENLDIIEFERPEGLVRVSVCSKSGHLPNESCQAAGTVVSDYFIEGRQPVQSCTMHSGRFYNRPPYIETDERWRSRGGAGRIPEDAEGTMRDAFFYEVAEQRGSSTAEITSLEAYIAQDGVTLQWTYEGPELAEFRLTRTGRGGDIPDTRFTIAPDVRQYADAGLAENNIYTYSLSAIFSDGTISEPAMVMVSTARTADGGMVRQPGSAGGGLVTVPRLEGSFESIAEMRARNAGLTIGRVERIHSDELQNRVIEQRPPAGTTVPAGTEVTLVVSLGSQ